MGDECPSHASMSELVTITANNTGWFKTIGKVIIGMLGGLFAILIPALITFFIYMSHIETRLTVLEQSVINHIQTTKKL